MTKQRNPDPRPTTYDEWWDLEEERDNLRTALDAANAELSRLRSSPTPVIRDPDDDDWDAFGFQQGTKAEVLRIWNRALSRSPAPVVGGVPELADSEVDKILSQRDEWEERATDLAEKVGTFLGVDVGEHSSANCPIASAMEALDEAIFAASRLPALKPGEVETCEWTTDPDSGEDDREYDTQCGKRFMLLHGGPAENGMRFCHSCGKMISIPPPVACSDCAHCYADHDFEGGAWDGCEKDHWVGERREDRTPAPCKDFALRAQATTNDGGAG